MDRRDKVNNVFRSLRFPKTLYTKLEAIAAHEQRDVTSMVLIIVQKFIDQAEQQKE